MTVGRIIAGIAGGYETILFGKEARRGHGTGGAAEVVPEYWTKGGLSVSERRYFGHAGKEDVVLSLIVRAML